MKVYFYIRLSNADSDIKRKDESDSIVNQRALLSQYLREHKEFFPYEVTEFIDDGFSGTNSDRPAFERMIESLKNGGAKLVLCKDLSRFFRDYVEIGDYLERVFPLLGVRLIAVNDGYDSDDYKGTTAGMDVVMKCIVYDFYSKDLSLKISTVLRARARKGQFIGAYTPYGYVKDPNDKHHLIIDRVAAPVVRRIFDMALQGMSTGKIASILNADHVESPSAHFNRLNPQNQCFRDKSSSAIYWDSIKVRVILQRREYTGAVVSNRKERTLRSKHTKSNDPSEWVIVPNCHEAIVSTEEFEKAQKAIRTITKREKYERHDYLLRGLIYCGECGKTMTRYERTRTKTYFHCSKNIHEGSPCPIGEKFYEEDLERVIISSLSQLLRTVVDNDRRVREAAAKSNGTAENIRRTIQRIEQSIRQNGFEKITAYEQYSDGKITREGFIRRRDELAADTERLTAEKEKLNEQLTVLEQAQESELHNVALSAQEFLSAKNVTNEMLMAFIRRVNVFTGDRIEIVYRFSDPFMEALANMQKTDS